jgi:hypothetical protein
VFPLSDNRKLAAQKLRLQLQIIFLEQVLGALQEVGRIIHCCSFLITKSEEWFSFGSTQRVAEIKILMMKN